METLYVSVPGVSNILSVNVSGSHTTQISTATIECLNTTLDIGSGITIDLGYINDYGRVFTGYVKNIDEEKSGSHKLTITASDVFIKAADYFIISSTPTNPMTVESISPEDIITALLALVDIIDLDHDTSNYLWGVSGPIEIQAVSVYDYCKMLADMIAWGFWADVYGGANFQDRRPYPMNDDAVVRTIANTDIISVSEWRSDKDLRNKVVVWGTEGVAAEAHATSPYLPNGFYKTAVVSSTIIDSQEMAQQACDFNLLIYNRLSRGYNASVVGNWLYGARKVIHLDYTNEDLYIYTSEHTWSSAGYVCNLELRKE